MSNTNMEHAIAWALDAQVKGRDGFERHSWWDA